MDPRSTFSGSTSSDRTSSGRAAGRRRRGAHRRPPAGVRRSGLYLGIAAAGAVLVGVVSGPGPAPQAAATAEPMSVATQLGMTASAVPADGTPDLQPLEQL